MKAETKYPVVLSVDDEVWAVPIGTKFSIADIRSCSDKKIGWIVILSDYQGVQHSVTLQSFVENWFVYLGKGLPDSLV